MWEETFVPLVIAFIAIIFLAIPVDAIIQGSEKLMERTPKLPDEFGLVFTYILTITISYVLVRDANFDFFKYVNLEFTPWVGYLLTAIMVGAGTKVLKQRFDIVSLIPMNVVGGLRSTMLRVGSKENQPTQKKYNPINYNLNYQNSYQSALENYYDRV